MPRQLAWSREAAHLPGMGVLCDGDKGCRQRCAERDSGWPHTQSFQTDVLPQQTHHDPRRVMPHRDTAHMCCNSRSPGAPEGTGLKEVALQFLSRLLGLLPMLGHSAERRRLLPVHPASTPPAVPRGT